MTVAELIEALTDLSPDARVYVWEGYDAGCMTTEFTINTDESGNVELY